MKSDIELKVIDLARGGSGVARDQEGRIVFIPFTAPGDHIKARVVKTQKNYLQAELVELMEPSPMRQVPPCSVFGQCGGCDWQHLVYDLQWETKVKGVQTALKRSGVLLDSAPDLKAAQKMWGYRNRVQLRGWKNQLGFYRRGTHEIIPIDSCQIARTEINEELEKIRQEGKKYDHPYKVEVEVLPSGEFKKTWESPHGALGFRQVNDEQNSVLKEWIVNAIGKVDVLYDLFGGMGNLSLPFIPLAKEIHCVDLGMGCLTSPAPHFFFHRASVHQWLEQQAGSFVKNGEENGFGIAILDPPREGLGVLLPSIALNLEKLGVQSLILVGCDADRWASDLSHWMMRRWQVEKWMIIDLFPQTTHVEAVAVLRRTN